MHALLTRAGIIFEDTGFRTNRSSRGEAIFLSFSPPVKLQKKFRKIIMIIRNMVK